MSPQLNKALNARCRLFRRASTRYIYKHSGELEGSVGQHLMRFLFVTKIRFLCCCPFSSVSRVLILIRECSFGGTSLPNSEEPEWMRWKHRDRGSTSKMENCKEGERGKVGTIRNGHGVQCNEDMPRNSSRQFSCDHDCKMGKHLEMRFHSSQLHSSSV